MLSDSITKFPVVLSIPSQNIISDVPTVEPFNPPPYTFFTLPATNAITVCSVFIFPSPAP